MAPLLRVLPIMLLAAVHTAMAQPLFENDEVLEIELSGPLHEIFKDKHDEVLEEKPFVLEAEGVHHGIEVRVRGNSRIRLCTFPPLRLDFDKDKTAGTVFAGQNKLKLVTHCSTSKFAETDVLEEYAAYRIFALLTEIAYRVRLVHIRYRDTDGRVSGIDEPRYGFLIEPEKQLAKRAGSNIITVPGVKLSRLNQEQATLVYVYQYLIANTDWSLANATDEEFCCHNVTLLCMQDLLVPVPFDFDMSGLVNAKYARPHPKVREIKRVTQRQYRGYCTDPDKLREALHSVLARRDAIRQIVTDLPGIDDKKKMQKLDFLDQVFEEAEDEDRLIEKFASDCL